MSTCKWRVQRGKRLVDAQSWRLLRIERGEPIASYASARSNRTAKHHTFFFGDAPNAARSFHRRRRALGANQRDRRLRISAAASPTLAASSPITRAKTSPPLSSAGRRASPASRQPAALCGGDAAARQKNEAHYAHKTTVGLAVNRPNSCLYDRLSP